MDLHEQIAEAQARIAAIRAEFTAAQTAKAARLASEELDWWIGRRAMLELLAR